MQSRDQEFYKKRFAQLEVVQLEELLRQDWQADGNLLNAEQTLAILEIIEGKKPSEVGEAEIEANWQSFLTHYLPLLDTGETLYEDTTIKARSTRRRFALPRLTWAAAILAVFILSSSLFAYQVYGYNVWDTIAQWTTEIFRLKSPAAPGRNPKEYAFQDATDARLQPLYLAMQELEIPTALAPTWVPDRFAGPPIVETSTTPFKGVITGFIQDQEKLLLSFEYITDADTMYEKDASPVTSRRINGVTYYFMSNNAQNLVVWTVDQYECFISGTVTYEELEQMVLSIYERG